MRGEMVWKVIDNSGIKTAKQLNVLSSKSQKSLAGDFLTVFPQRFKYIRVIKRQKYLGLVTATRKIVTRPGGITLKGKLNSLVILNFQKKFLGSAIFKPAYKELRRRRKSYIYLKVRVRVPEYI